MSLNLTVSFVFVVFLAATGTVVCRQSVQITLFTYLSTSNLISLLFVVNNGEA